MINWITKNGPTDDDVYIQRLATELHRLMVKYECRSLVFIDDKDPLKREFRADIVQPRKQK